MGRERKRNPRLALYAGPSGWRNPEYFELAVSAREALGSANVVSGIAPQRSRVLHCLFFLISERPTHFFYDPRWGVQSRWGSELEGRAIGLVLWLIRAVPISILNDLPETRWRRKISLASSHRGICLVLVKPEIGRVFAPEISNQVGPMPMPLSVASFRKLKSRWRPIDEVSLDERVQVSFVGSLYEPRTSMLLAAKQRLEQRGVSLIIHGRELHEPKIESETYYTLLGQSKFTFTTAEQALTSQSRPHPIHLVYRYIEALASGSVLIAPSVPGADKYFVPGIHYIECPSVDFLVNAISKIIKNRQQVNAIQVSGRARVEELVEQKFYWSRIDQELRKHGCRPLFVDSSG